MKLMMMIMVMVGGDDDDDGISGQYVLSTSLTSCNVHDSLHAITSDLHNSPLRAEPLLLARYVQIVEAPVFTIGRYY